MIDDKKIKEAKKAGISIDQDADDHFVVISNMVVTGPCIKLFAHDFLKDLWHPASEVPRNDNGKFLAFSIEYENRKLYDMNDMLDETDCADYQKMWENEVKTHHLTHWIFVEDLIDLVTKGGEQ